jgi:AcrR family transcriptional regulator
VTSERAPGPRGTETRQRILDAAERLMAERGIEGVSLNEINAAAGQRNTAALHYHFGGREGLVRAILRRHGTWLRARHDELYAEVTGGGRRRDVRSLVEVMVLPVAEYIGRGSSQRAAIRIWTSTLARPEIAIEDVRTMVDPALTVAARTLVEIMAESMPRELAVERMVVVSQSAMHVLADRAILEDAPGSRRRPLPLPLVAANLVDMMAAALTAPVGAATAEAADAAIGQVSGLCGWSRRVWQPEQFYGRIVAGDRTPDGVAQRYRVADEFLIAWRASTSPVLKSHVKMAATLERQAGDAGPREIAADHGRGPGQRTALEHRHVRLERRFGWRQAEHPAEVSGLAPEVQLDHRPGRQATALPELHGDPGVKGFRLNLTLAHYVRRELGNTGP